MEIGAVHATNGVSPASASVTLAPAMAETIRTSGSPMPRTHTCRSARSRGKMDDNQEACIGPRPTRFRRVRWCAHRRPMTAPPRERGTRIKKLGVVVRVEIELPVRGFSVPGRARRGPRKPKTGKGSPGTRPIKPPRPSPFRARPTELHDRTKAGIRQRFPLLQSIRLRPVFQASASCTALASSRSISMRSTRLPPTAMR